MLPIKEFLKNRNIGQINKLQINKIKNAQNKIPDVSGLVSNAAFNTKIAEVEKKS